MKTQNSYNYRFVCAYSVLVFFILSTFNSFSVTYTWNKVGGGSWTTVGNWTPASPAGGPPNGSDVVIIALTDATKFIDAIPTRTLNSLVCTGSGNGWLRAASSGNMITLSTTWSVPSTYTLLIGNNSERLVWTLENTCTGTLDGYCAFDAGSTNRNFTVYGTLIVNSTGMLYDPNPSGGSDFYLMSGATLKTQKIQGLTTTSPASAAAINYNVAVCFGGSYFYNTGANYEYNGTADQITGVGLNQNKPANVTINNSSTKIVTLSANTNISGNLTINANSTFSIAALTFSIGATTGAGGFINNGTFNSGTGTVLFNGNAAQTISGTTNTTFYNLTLSNASGLTLSTPSNVQNNLTLTSGLLNTTTANILTMLNGSSAPAKTDASTSYINGPMSYVKNVAGSTTLNFPIGKSPDCRPFRLTVNHTNTNLYTYLGESFNASAKALGYTLPGTIDTVSSVHYWDITRYNNASVITPTTDLSGSQTVILFFGSNDGVKDLATLKVAKNTYTAAAAWTDLGGASAGSISSGSITSGGFTSFSRFTLAGSAAGINPLPVELLYFDATLNNKVVDVQWATATEKNVNYFIVERSSDAIHFDAIGTVSTKAINGNSQTILNYSTTDFNPLEGYSYYRLKQTDLDGKVEYSKIVSVDLTASEKITLTVYPNPNNGEFVVRYNGLVINSDIDIQLLDVLGKLVYNSTVMFENSNGTIKVNPVEKLQSGIYFCKLITQGKTYTTKLIVN